MKYGKWFLGSWENLFSWSINFVVIFFWLHLWNFYHYINLFLYLIQCVFVPPSKFKILYSFLTHFIPYHDSSITTKRRNTYRIKIRSYHHLLHWGNQISRATAIVTAVTRHTEYINSYVWKLNVRLRYRNVRMLLDIAKYQIVRTGCG